MIDYPASTQFQLPYQISEQMRHAALKRKGEWELVTWDKVLWEDLGCCPRLKTCCAAKFRRTTIVLKQEEISKLLHLGAHGTFNGTKVETIHGNMQQTAMSMWQSGSLEHTALRAMVPPMLARWQQGHTEIRRRWWRPCESKRLKTTLVWGDYDRRALDPTAAGKLSQGTDAAPPDDKCPIVRATERCLQKMDETSYSAGMRLGDLLNRCTDRRPWITDEMQMDMLGMPLEIRPGYTPPRPPGNFTTQDGPSRPAEHPLEVMQTSLESFLSDIESVESFLDETPLPPPSEPPPPDTPPPESGGEPALPPPAEPPSPVEEKPALGESPIACNDTNEHGGVNPECADIIANEGTNHLWKKDGVCLVVGQEWKKEKVDEKQIVGVLTAPIPQEPQVYANSLNNVKGAIEERINAKKRPFEATPQDKAKIGKLVREAINDKNNGRQIWSTAQIEAWAQKHFDFSDMKSGKWSNQRLETGLANLYTKADPGPWKMCASIKAEPMPRNKPPRLIIADGDEGQLMALAVIKCFEDLLFEHQESRSIKHLGKRDAIGRVVQNLSREVKGERPALIEGDGSAWDACCRKEVRDLVENPVLWHIMQVLIKYGVAPESWLKVHHYINTQEKLKLFFREKFAQVDAIKVEYIEAIRRSGHRGTSCLNWWCNFVLWACSVYQEPWRMLNPNTFKALDVTGKLRWWFAGFEGDDSICALWPKMTEKSDLAKLYLAWWERMGFNMKIVFVDKVATFCGYHLACKEGVPTGFYAPEVPRAMNNSGVSCSPGIIAAAKKGEVRAVKNLAAASAIARAHDFAGIYPTISRKYQNLAQELISTREFHDREMSMRTKGEEGWSFDAINKDLEKQNSMVSLPMERENLEKVCCGASEEEVLMFETYHWDFDTFDNFQDFHASLPLSWRPPP